MSDKKGKGKLSGEWGNILGSGQLKAKKKADAEKLKKLKCQFCSKMFGVEQARKSHEKSQHPSAHSTAVQKSKIKLEKLSKSNSVSSSSSSSHREVSPSPSPHSKKRKQVEPSEDIDADEPKKKKSRVRFSNQKKLELLRQYEM